jgi:hypothetical protein
MYVYCIIPNISLVGVTIGERQIQGLSSTCCVEAKWISR